LTEILAEMSRAEDATRRRAHASAPRVAAEMLEDAPAPELVVPDPYFLRPDATGMLLPAETGLMEPRVFAYAPILITGRLRDVDSGSESLVVTWRRPAGWLEKVVDRGVAVDGRRLVELASDGFPVASDNNREVARYLHRLEATNYAELPQARVSSHMGWQGPG